MRYFSWLMAAAVAAVLICSLAVQAEDAKPAAPAGEEFKIKGDAAKGAETYKLYWGPCRVEKGMGDGIAGAALNPKRRSFTDKAVMAAIPDKEVYTAIKDGGVAVGKSPLMVAWGPVLGDDQKIHDVAAYVRSFAK